MLEIIIILCSVIIAVNVFSLYCLFHLMKVVGKLLIEIADIVEEME